MVTRVEVALRLSNDADRRVATAKKKAVRLAKQTEEARAEAEVLAEEARNAWKTWYDAKAAEETQV